MSTMVTVTTDVMRVSPANAVCAFASAEPVLPFAVATASAVPARCRDPPVSELALAVAFAVLPRAFAIACALPPAPGRRHFISAPPPAPPAAPALALAVPPLASETACASPPARRLPNLWVSPAVAARRHRHSRSQLYPRLPRFRGRTVDSVNAVAPGFPLTTIVLKIFSSVRSAMLGFRKMD